MSKHPPTEQGAVTQHGRERTPGMILLSVLFRAGVVIGVLAIGAMIFMVLASSRQADGDNPDPPAPMVVSTVQVSRLGAPRIWVGYGTARAMDATDVSAEVGAVVVQRPAAIEPGVAVDAGDLLIRLDPEDFEQAIQSSEHSVRSIESELGGIEVEQTRLAEQLTLARGEADAAARDFQRADEALRAGAGSQSEVDTKLAARNRAQRAVETLRQQIDLIPSRRDGAHARLAAEQTRLRRAQRDLDRTTITSPIAGVLQSIEPETGEVVARGQLVARVVDLRRVEVPLLLPVSAGGSITIGDRVELRSGATDAGLWSGLIARIAPEADQRSRTIAVFVEVTQNPADRSAEMLLPGRFVMGRVNSDTARQRLIVPRRALDGDRLFLADAHTGNPDGDYSTVHPVSVRVAYHLDGLYPGLDPHETEWAVLAEPSPVAPGDRVIISNLQQLHAELIVDARAAHTGALVDSPGAGP